MSIVQVKGAGGVTGLDRTSFVGVRIPQEIQAMIKPLATIERGTFTKVMKVVLAALNQNDDELQYETIQNLLNESLTEELLSVLYCGISSLLKKALRIPSTSLKKEHFIQDLQDLQIPKDFQEDLVACVFGTKRTELDDQIENYRPRLPSLDNLDWRVDVAISTGVLSRVLVRGVTMEMTLSDGTIKDFEMPVSKFQDLRFQVATVLSEMEKLEKRSILKIKD